MGNGNPVEATRAVDVGQRQPVAFTVLKTL